MLALAILGGSLAVLSTIATTGADAAIEARDLATARLLCETKMSELLLSGVAPQPVSLTPVAAPDNQSLASYQYSVEVQPAPISGLLAVRVTVVSDAPAGAPPSVQFALVRWMVDPALGLAEAEAEEKALAAEEEAAAAAASEGSPQ